MQTRTGVTVNGKFYEYNTLSRHDMAAQLVLYELKRQIYNALKNDDYEMIAELNKYAQKVYDLIKGVV